MKRETEVKSVVLGYVGGVGHLSFLEEREPENQFLDMRIKVPVFDFSRYDDFALWGGRWFLFISGTASAEQEQGEEE